MHQWPPDKPVYDREARCRALASLSRGHVAFSAIDLKSPSEDARICAESTGGVEFVALVDRDASAYDGVIVSAAGGDAVVSEVRWSGVGGRKPVPCPDRVPGFPEDSAVIMVCHGGSVEALKPPGSQQLTELTIERTVRDDLWVARDGEESVLVRSVPAERLGFLRARGANVSAYSGNSLRRSRRNKNPVRRGRETTGPGLEQCSGTCVAQSDQPGAAVQLRHRPRHARARTNCGNLAWLHAAGFLHGNVTPNTIWLHPRGWIRFAGLDCLQPAQGPLCALRTPASIRPWWKSLRPIPWSRPVRKPPPSPPM